MNLKKIVIGTSIAAAVLGGVTVLPVAVAAPANAGPLVCHTVKTLHTKANCDRAVRICGYYTYKEICD